MTINARTTLCAVIGHPIGHSMSPALHNAAYQAMGLNWVYTAFDVEDTGAAMAGMRGLGIRGLSVTIPHKLAVMEHLDEIEPIAKAIGAVNTVTNEGGRLVGTNTDGYGALRALRTKTEPNGRRVVLIGCGGGARAVAMALAQECECSSLAIHARDEDRAQRDGLAEDVQKNAAFPVEKGGIKESELIDRIREAEIVFQATPIGMAPDVDGCLVPKESWREGQLAFDLVYNPAETRFLREAREAGADGINGLPMLIQQGAEQIRRWSGQEPPIDVMEDAAKRAMEANS